MPNVPEADRQKADRWCAAACQRSDRYVLGGYDYSRRGYKQARCAVLPASAYM